MTRSTKLSIRLDVACTLAWAGTVLTAPLGAQAAGSTLTQLIERSDSVVTAKALRMQDDGLTRRATFRWTSALKEKKPGGFRRHITLSEPSGQACGRALHGVLTGSSYVLFLTHDRDGTRLTVGSSRSIVGLDPEVLAFVRNYVGAAQSRDQITTMTKALTSRSDRVRRDASIALPLHRSLESARSEDRARILDALSMAAGREDIVTHELTRTAARLRLKPAARILLPHYLEGGSPAMRDLLSRVLPELDGAGIAQQLSLGLPGGMAAKRRAIALLERCPARAATDCLSSLTRSRSVSVSRLASAALSRLATRGESQHRFRSIDPRSRRTRDRGRRGGGPR